VVPTRSLALPDTAMLDPWGNRIGYSVIKDLAKNNGAFRTYTTALTTGVIQLTDLNGNQIPNDITETVIAYVLVTHGKDGKGAANRQGTVVNACNNAAKDGENCDNDVVFRDIDIQDSTAAANYFDDTLRWKEVVSLGSGPEDSMSDVTRSVMTDWESTCIISSDKRLYCTGLSSAWSEPPNGTARQRHIKQFDLLHRSLGRIYGLDASGTAKQRRLRLRSPQQRASLLLGS